MKSTGADIRFSVPGLGVTQRYETHPGRRRRLGYVRAVTDILIRPFATGDAEAVRQVVSAAFHPGNEAELVERIRASDRYVEAMELVAVDGEEIIGHVMVSGTSITDDSGESSTISMLSPLAVAPERQRQGIGGTLVRAVIEIADRSGEPLIVLEGDPTYYSRLGFVPAATLGIDMPLPDWAPPEAAQVLRLSSYDPSDVRLCGRVTYSPAFDGFS